MSGIGIWSVRKRHRLGCWSPATTHRAIMGRKLFLVGLLPQFQPLRNPATVLIALRLDPLEIHAGSSQVLVSERFLHFHETAGIFADHPCERVAGLVDVGIRNAG